MDKKTPKQQADLSRQHKDHLKKLIGTFSDSKDLKERMRRHQGWWRAFVLGLPSGEYKQKKGGDWNTVCNRTFEETTPNFANFLTKSALEAVQLTLKDRDNLSKGIIQENRLYYNLLSSQPLAFNFFGELKKDTDFGLRILQSWWPDITALKKVVFEFVPEEGGTGDNSAFDVAFKVEAGSYSGVIGLECKYTDTFSYKPSYQKGSISNLYYGELGQINHKKYHPIFLKSESRFAASYEDFVSNKKFNQLFRNELIMEPLIQNHPLDFFRTGLFCSPDDSEAMQSGREFQSMLIDGQERFKIITYADFISRVQTIHLSWEQREWTMLLWARYCGRVLSDWKDQEWISEEQQKFQSTPL